MSQRLKTKQIQLQGLTCVACEAKIENKLKKLPGVEKLQVSYVTQILEITYDPSILSMETIRKTIEVLHYQVVTKAHANALENKSRKHVEILIIALILGAGYLLIDQTVGFQFIPELDQGVGMAALFIIGLLTSVHCVAMCGGITLSLCMGVNPDSEKSEKKQSVLKTLLFYHSGRLVSYSLIGGIVGAIGSIFALSYAGKASIQMIAGVFMVLMGMQLLLQSPWLKKIIPHMPKFFARKIYQQKSGRGPFLVGMLNGVMPCGPLSAMQIYALGTGSFLLGALSMFLFTLGTIPLLLTFGMLSGLLKNRFNKVLLKVSAVLVLVLGISMIQRGLAFVPSNNINTSAEVAVVDTDIDKTVEEQVETEAKDEVQELTTTLSSRNYEDITVKAGVPVKWTILADENALNGCNNVLAIPDLQLQVVLKTGENIIEFTPTTEGVIGYSCWMGMIRNLITVIGE